MSCDYQIAFKTSWAAVAYMKDAMKLRTWFHVPVPCCWTRSCRRLNLSTSLYAPLNSLPWSRTVRRQDFLRWALIFFNQVVVFKTARGNRHWFHASIFQRTFFRKMFYPLFLNSSLSENIFETEKNQHEESWQVYQQWWFIALPNGKTSWPKRVWNLRPLGPASYALPLRLDQCGSVNWCFIFSTCCIRHWVPVWSCPTRQKIKSCKRSTMCGRSSRNSKNHWYDAYPS